jgi:replication initiation protein RepC
MSIETVTELAQPGSRISGARRINLAMLMARDQADGFAGVPRGTAKPFHFLTAFQEAEPYLGLPAHAFKLVSWLVKQTQPQDWEEGSRPIAWPSARVQEEFLGISETRVKALNRIMCEARIFVLRDNEQGKRYGRRGPDGRIIEAYGFDLSLLALRCEEFVRIAAEARIERNRMTDLRKRATIARRAIRAIGEELATLGQVPAGWPRLAADTAALTASVSKSRVSDELAVVVHGLERRKIEAEQWLRDAPKPVNKDPEGAENGPHTTYTNLPENLSDTVIAAEESSRPGVQPVPSPTPAAPPPEKRYRLKPSQFIDLFPRLARCVLTENPAHTHVLDAAGSYLRDELGVSQSLWGEACRIMGREDAAIALAIVSTKPDSHFTRGAGGYFAGMLRKAEKGELHLDRTLWALREAKWGKPNRRRLN